MPRGSLLVASCVAWLIANLWVPQQAQAQLSGQAMRRLELETAWTSHVEMPTSAKPIVSSHIWPSSEKARQFAETVVRGRQIRVFADALGADGKPIGFDAAKEQAKSLAARVLGTFDGIEIKEGSIPKIYLVVITSDGVVQTFDAETGQNLWRVGSGKINTPTGAGSVGRAGVAMTKGSRLFIFDWATGLPKKTLPLQGSSSVGAALANSVAIVPTFNGVIGAYGIGKPLLRPWQYTGHGIPLNVPTPAMLSNPSVAGVVTDKGMLYVFADVDGKPAAWFRFTTQSPLVGSVSATASGFYVGDVNGNLFKVATARRGDLLWRYSMGSPLIDNPLIIGEKAFFVNQSRALLALNDADGADVWSNSNASIDRLILASKKRLYARGTGGRLVVLDISNGQLVAQSEPNSIDAFVTNPMNDRLYLIGRDGQLQCLRESGTEQPTMHVVIPPEESPKLELQPGADSQSTANATGEPAAATDSTNPFESATAGTETPAESPAGENPFGETQPAPAAGEGANPFDTGNGANPFGPQP